jgi:hypothetical protein
MMKHVVLGISRAVHSSPFNEYLSEPVLTDHSIPWLEVGRINEQRFIRAAMGDRERHHGLSADKPCWTSVYGCAAAMLAGH